MASTPSNSRTSFLANTGISKSTPTNSPFSRTPRSPTKPRGPYESGLSLKRIIGTTVTSPTCFDTLHDANLFAYTAGAAAVVVKVEKDETFKQRFYRARPTALPQSTTSQSYGTPSTPTHSANDSRNRSSRDSILPYTPNTHSSGLDWGDSPGSKTWTSRERIKAATCLSLSRDGRFLAVGETGYSPRVLIFSLQEGSSDVPVAILSEHTFGVRAVAFSADGRYLASIGHPNDGFLYVWSINPRTGGAKLHSSNKCTSNIKQMLWLGKNVVTIGTRHIKTWKVEEKRSVSPTKRRYNLDGTPIPVPTPPAVKTLVGRNVLLGPLVDATFTAMATISDQKAVVGSDKGDLCLLDDSEGHKLARLGECGFSITSVAIDAQGRRVNIGGVEGKSKSISLDVLLTPTTPPQSPVPIDEPVTGSAGTICAMGFMNSRLITVDSKHSIRVSMLELDQITTRPPIVPFTAHGDAVLGVRQLSAGNKLNSAFLTWSADGTIMFWDEEGKNTGEMRVIVEQLPCAGEEDPLNQCNIVQPSKDGSYLVTGDRYGVLRVYETGTERSIFEARAHSSDILDIAIREVQDRTMIVSCGRDRMLQVFSLENGDWDLTQTIDEHTASVCGVLFSETGDRVLSCSADRTIHIRQMVTRENGGKLLTVAVPERIITVKTSPTSMVLGRSDQVGMVVVSQLDRSVSTYELSTGKCMASFRAIDNESTDAVALDGLQICIPDSISGRPTVLAGFSSTDKSIRVYDALSGKFLDREWGHTSAVTDIALLEPSDTAQKNIISTGSDGTVMMWELNEASAGLGDPISMMSDSSEPSPPKDALAIRLPIRRVLSRSELSEFQRISPVSTPTGRTSPPRIMKHKTSRYGLGSAYSPSLPPPLPSLSGSKHLHTVSDDSAMPRKKSMSRIRARSRSPPSSPRMKENEKNVSRRTSLASLHSENGGSLRGRTKSSTNINEFGSLNMATEQTCRQLRAYRKKLLGNESVREDGLAELEKELRLTMAALADRTSKLTTFEGRGIDEEVMEGILDKASDRLLSLFTEKLRFNKVDSFDSIAEDGLTIDEDNTKDDSVSPTTVRMTATGSDTFVAPPLRKTQSSTLLRRDSNKGVLQDTAGKENAQTAKSVDAVS